MPGYIIILHKCTKNSWSYYTAPEICHMTDIIVIFLSFFFFLPCHSDGDIIVLHMYTKNYNHMMYSSWDRVRDGGTDLIKNVKIDNTWPFYVLIFVGGYCVGILYGKW